MFRSGQSRGGGGGRKQIGVSRSRLDLTCCNLSPTRIPINTLRAPTAAVMGGILSEDKLYFAEEQFSSEELELLKGLAEVS